MVRFCGVLTQMRSAFLTAPIDWNQANLVLYISNNPGNPIILRILVQTKERPNQCSVRLWYNRELPPTDRRNASHQIRLATHRTPLRMTS